MLEKYCLPWTCPLHIFTVKGLYFLHSTNGPCAIVHLDPDRSWASMFIKDFLLLITWAAAECLDLGNRTVLVAKIFRNSSWEMLSLAATLLSKSCYFVFMSIAPRGGQKHGNVFHLEPVVLIVTFSTSASPVPALTRPSCRSCRPSRASMVL